MKPRLEDPLILSALQTQDKRRLKLSRYFEPSSIKERPRCLGASTALQQGFGVQSYRVGGQKEAPRRCPSHIPTEGASYPGVIWTHSLLIWSQTRCHCATRSGMGGPLPRCHPEIRGLLWGNGNFVSSDRGVAPTGFACCLAKQRGL